MGSGVCKINARQSVACLQQAALSADTRLVSTAASPPLPPQFQHRNPGARGSGGLQKNAREARGRLFCKHRRRISFKHRDLRPRPHSDAILSQTATPARSSLEQQEASGFPSHSFLQHAGTRHAAAQQVRADPVPRPPGVGSHSGPDLQLGSSAGQHPRQPGHASQAKFETGHVRQARPDSRRGNRPASRPGSQPANPGGRRGGDHNLTYNLTYSSTLNRMQV